MTAPEMPVLITGGTGRLGRFVVARLLDAGCEVRVLARRDRATAPRATFFTGDLRTGEGVGPAVHGAGTIIHCATANRGDVETTKVLIREASRSGSPHVLYVSIVGIDQMASWGYPKSKLECERIVQNSGLPWTILRATQFYDYILDNSRKMSALPVTPVPSGFQVRPVHPDEVAARLVELALGEPAGRVADIAGPQESSWDEMFRSYLRAMHRRRLVVPVRIPGTRAVRNGGLLPAPGYTAGSRTWDQYLTATQK